MPLIHTIARATSKAEVWKLPEEINTLIEEGATQGIEVPSEIMAFKNQSRIAQYLLARMITKNHFGHFNIQYHPNGKPYLKEGYLSMSHTRHYFTWYFNTHHEIGIDIEEQSPRVMRIRHKFMNEEEKEYCAEDVLKSLVIWCAKESIFKKFGSETTYFKENIHVSPFKPVDKFDLTAQVTANNSTIEQKLHCELIHELVMVYTD